MARSVYPKRVAERRAAILTAAASLSASNWFAGTTIAAVARGAWMSSGNVFHCFPDKAALFRGGVFEQSIVEFAQLVERYVHHPNPVPTLLDLIEAQVGQALDPVATGLMVEVLAAGRSRWRTRPLTAEEELAFTTYRVHADPDNPVDPRPLVRLTIIRLLTAGKEFNDQRH